MVEELTEQMSGILKIYYLEQYIYILNTIEIQYTVCRRMSFCLYTTSIAIINFRWQHTKRMRQTTKQAQ